MLAPATGSASNNISGRNGWLILECYGAVAQPCRLRPARCRTGRRLRLGIACSHPFTDGNKRTAAAVRETFLVLNDYRLTASDAEVVVAFMALAAGELTEAELAD